MDTKDIVIEKIRDILRDTGVKRAALFGSRARGQASSSSDIDILVELEERKTLLDLIALKNHLEQAVRLKVDLITYKSLSPLIRDAILREQIPLI